MKLKRLEKSVAKRYKKISGRKKWLLVALLGAVFIFGSVTLVRDWYFNNLRPVSSSTTSSYFTIESGATPQQIATDLQRSNLIRSSKTFVTYVRGNELSDKLQAGTYILTPSMSVQQIVKKMTSGDVAKNLLTILPGKTLSQIKTEFTAAGYSQSEVDSAFNASQYSDEPALASLPKGADLEGFLYPDSFQKQADTPASTIIRESLAEMQKNLTTDIVDGFAAHGLSVYQGITLASIVYQESGDPSSQPTIAQVFYSRIANGMPLQSNVTADYAADLAGVARTVTIDSPYNTYLHTGLPPGPIGNVTSAVLKAVAHPASTSYLYFVADEQTHVIYFSSTQAEQDDLISQHCPNTCAQ